MRFIIILAFFMVSCTPQKRFQHLIEKHPELIKTLDAKITIHDTIIKKDTIFVKGTQVVAPFNIDSLKDIFTDIYDDSLMSISLSLDKARKIRAKVTIKDRIITNTDTIYYTKEVIVPAKVIVEKDMTWFWLFVGACLASVLMAYVCRKN